MGNWIIKFVIPLAAVGLLAFAVSFVSRESKKTEHLPPPIEPARAPFADTVAGAGIVEAETENISVGSPVAGVVVEVFAKVGDKVQGAHRESDRLVPGTALFRLDDRQLLSELRVRQAALKAAEADLDRLNNQPRPEQRPVNEAQVTEADANLADAADQYRRAQELYSRHASSAEDLTQKQQAYYAARARLAQAKASLALLNAGAWSFDKQVSAAAIEQARTQIESTKIDIERLTINALIDGEVLQVNVRPGEYVGTPPNQALIVLGSTKELHVRVDIDEQDIPRFVAGAPAQAALKGSAKDTYPLRFVRVEPYVVPKKSLTGDNTERVDTRVLQVIYALEPKGRPLYVGQQLDAYIDVAKTAQSDKTDKSAATTNELAPR
jgi:HlyD family secretion protein